MHEHLLELHTNNWNFHYHQIPRHPKISIHCLFLVMRQKLLPVCLNHPYLHILWQELILRFVIARTICWTFYSPLCDNLICYRCFNSIIYIYFNICLKWNIPKIKYWENASNQKLKKRKKNLSIIKREKKLTKRMESKKW